MRLKICGAVATILALCAAPSVAHAAPATAAARSDTVCIPVHASGQGQDLGNFKTVAKIFVGPVLIGTTAATFTPTGVSGTVVSFTGPIVFTALGNLGTFTVTALGTVDVSTGNFQSAGPVTASTGLLSGTTGHLVFVGNENLTTGAFTETITGQLCLGGTSRSIMAA
jgi:hypothetical protein